MTTTAEQLRRQAAEIIKQARSDLEGIPEKATQDETKAIQDKAEALLNEATTLTERARQVERIEALEAEDHIRNEAKTVQVESGGDISHRKLDAADDTSYLQERFKPPSMQMRETRKDIWDRHFRGEKLTDEEHSIRQRDFPEDIACRYWMRYGKQAEEKLARRYGSNAVEHIRTNLADTDYPLDGDFQDDQAFKLADGTNFLPKKLADSITWKMKYFGPMLDVSNLIRTSDGNAINYPTMDATSKKAVIVGEGKHPGIEKMSSENVSIGTYEYATKILPISIPMMQDSEYDVEGMVTNWMAEQFGRGMNEHMTTGTGSSQPAGIVTRIAGVTAQKAVSTISGTAGNTDVNLVDLLNMTYLVDKAYRHSGCIFLMNDKLCNKLLAKTYGSGDGRFLWGNLMGGQPMSIWGNRIEVNNEIPLAKNKAAVVYGDFSYYYARVVRQITMNRSDELGMAQRVIMFGNWVRGGGDTLLKEPFSVLFTNNA